MYKGEQIFVQIPGIHFMVNVHLNIENTISFQSIHIHVKSCLKQVLQLIYTSSKKKLHITIRKVRICFKIHAY